MKCVDCAYFRIIYEPIKYDKDIWDLGRVACKKHDLVTDFANHRKLNRLECVDGMPKEE